MNHESISMLAEYSAAYEITVPDYLPVGLNATMPKGV